MNLNATKLAKAIARHYPHISEKEYLEFGLELRDAIQASPIKDKQKMIDNLVNFVGYRQHGNFTVERQTLLGVLLAWNLEENSILDFIHLFDEETL